MATLFACTIPTVNFSTPEPIQENQETISPSILTSDDLHIQLHLNTSHHVFHVTDPNCPLLQISRSDTIVQSSIYLTNQLQHDSIITELLLHVQIPEDYHLNIICSILFQVCTTLNVYECAASSPTTPLLFRVDVSWDKFYYNDDNIFCPWFIMRALESQIEATYHNNEEEYYTRDNDEEEEEEDGEYDYWMPEYVENDDGLTAASESAIKSMVKRQTMNEKKEGLKCTICLEEFIEGSVTGCMPCSHIFHDECITNWLRKSHYCPLCRFEMPTTA